MSIKAAAAYFIQSGASCFTISGLNIQVTVDLCTMNILRFRIGNGPGPKASFVAEQNWPREVFASSTPDELSTHQLKLSLRGETLLIADKAGTPRFSVDLTTIGRDAFSLRILGEQHFYGLGQGGQPFDRLGTSRRLWNNHVNHGQGGDIGVPLLLSNCGIGLFFDNTSEAWINSGNAFDETWINYRCSTEGLDLYLIGGDSLRKTMGDVADLLGHAPLPPLWSLGYLQSTRHFENPEELADLMSAFRARRFPCDAIVLLSSYGDMLGWNKGVGFIDWSTRLVPDPEALARKAKALGFHLILHEYPVLHAEAPQGENALAAGYLLESGFPSAPPAKRPSINYNEGQRHIDFSNSEAGVWWWSHHRDLLSLGISGWWLDGGEGPPVGSQTSNGPALVAHNTYDLARLKAFAEGEARDRPSQRSFMLCRSGGPGMQRYSGACWSGDINNSAATLAGQIALGLNVGLSGIPYWGTDIGGYYPSSPLNGEMFARWFQFGAFCPIFRAHGRTWRMHLPWAYGPQIEAICRAFSELRYQLAPYNNTLAWQAHLEGLPFMRPLALNYPNDPRTWDMADQYLWGDDILVAPVTRLSARTWPVYLPKGRWTDFWSHEEFEGPIDVEVDAPLERMPLFVRAGAIIPMRPSGDTVADSLAAPLTFRIFPSASSSFVMQEDDGLTRNYEAGDFSTLTISCAAGASQISISIEHSGQKSAKDTRIRFEILARQNPEQITADGDLVAQGRPSSMTPTINSWHHNDCIPLICIDLRRLPSCITINL